MLKNYPQQKNQNEEDHLMRYLLNGNEPLQIVYKRIWNYSWKKKFDCNDPEKPLTITKLLGYLPYRFNYSTDRYASDIGKSWQNTMVDGIIRSARDLKNNTNTYIHTSLASHDIFMIKSGMLLVGEKLVLRQLSWFLSLREEYSHF